MTPTTNAEQAELWNGDDGRHWVKEQDRYDRMLAPFIDPILDAASIDAADRVLDIGCGTGATACAAASRCPGGTVHGVDISAPMIEAARERAERLGLTNTRFDVADAQTMATSADTDVAVSRFGVMFFDNPTAAFANIRSALRPGGRLALAVWQSLFDNEWVAVQATAAARHVPIPEPGPPDAPGPFSLGDPDRLRATLRDAGFERIELDAHAIPVLLAGGGSLDDTVEFLRSTGVARTLFAGAAPRAVDEALAAIKAALEPYATPEGARLGSATWIVRARAPGGA